MTIIKLTPTQSSLVKYGTSIRVNDETWHHVPFWYRETEEENVFEEVPFEKLPDYLKEAIEHFKNGNLDGITLQKT